MLVELSSADVHVEDSASPELWKHRGHQASRADPPYGPPCWIAHQRGLMLGSTCTVRLIQAVGWERFRFWVCILIENPASHVIRLLCFYYVFCSDCSQQVRQSGPQYFNTIQSKVWTPKGSCPSLDIIAVKEMFKFDCCNCRLHCHCDLLTTSDE